MKTASAELQNAAMERLNPRGVTGDRTLELALLGAAVLMALASAVFSYMAWDLSKSAAWDYSGGQSCAAYRDQVIQLQRLDVPEEEVRAWFAGEDGGKWNPAGATSDHNTALGDFEDGCGSVSDLLAVLNDDVQPSDELMDRVANP
jgi:hypothetical protein